MATTIVIGLIVLALLAIVALTATVRRSDTQSAIGQLSGETVRRDRSKVEVGGEGSSSSGRAVEANARAERSGELVAVKDRAPVEYSPYVPPDPETLGVTRRQFLNRSIIAMFSVALAGFGAAIIAQLWPRPTEGFGAKINIGRIDNVKSEIVANGGFFYVPLGRLWVTEYPANAVLKAQNAYSFYPKVEQGLKAGVVALFQTCPHLGCRVPDCQTSQWFECPCHGSQYNQVGEKKGGPAPRGMDRFPMEVTAANELIVDTGDVIQGPPIGTNTTGQEAEGPNCLSAGGGH